MKLTIFFITIIISALFFQPALAYKTIDASEKFLGETVKPTGLSTDNLQTSTGKFIQSALLLVGTVFLGLMVYGGFTWMTARGEEDKITKAKETVIAASIGIGIILAAYAVTAFITTNLINEAGNSPGNACANTLSSCLESCSNANIDDAAARESCNQGCDDAFSQCIQNS